MKLRHAFDVRAQMRQIGIQVEIIGIALDQLGEIVRRDRETGFTMNVS